MCLLSSCFENRSSPNLLKPSHALVQEQTLRDWDDALYNRQWKTLSKAPCFTSDYKWFLLVIKVKSKKKKNSSSQKILSFTCTLLTKMFHYICKTILNITQKCLNKIVFKKKNEHYYRQIKIFAKKLDFLSTLENESFFCKISRLVHILEQRVFISFTTNKNLLRENWPTKSTKLCSGK